MWNKRKPVLFRLAEQFVIYGVVHATIVLPCQLSFTSPVVSIITRSSSYAWAGKKELDFASRPADYIAINFSLNH